MEKGRWRKRDTLPVPHAGNGAKTSQIPFLLVSCQIPSSSKALIRQHPGGDTEICHCHTTGTIYSIVRPGGPHHGCRRAFVAAMEETLDSRERGGWGGSQSSWGGRCWGRRSSSTSIVEVLPLPPSTPKHHPLLPSGALGPTVLSVDGAAGWQGQGLSCSLCTAPQAHPSAPQTQDLPAPLR
jgi:hypothetical protein